jgi:hypothetical protein
MYWVFLALPAGHRVQIRLFATVMKQFELTITPLLAILSLSTVSGQSSASSSKSRDPFTVSHVVKFAPGTEGQRAALKKMAVVGGMVDGDFVIANEDLNDDGNKEIIVMSLSRLMCGTQSCATVVLQKRPNGIAIIFSQNLLPGGLAVTNEKIGAYRALATVDEKGKIAIGDKRGTPMFGKQLVYPMNNH